MAVALAAALAVLALLWSVPGLDMYPLDDGWVLFSSQSLGLQWADFVLGNSRELRTVPYIVARALEDDGFRVANLILIGLDLAIFVGLFLVFQRVLRGRNVAAFTAAGLAMLFPGDYTMFWLGAYGVNISYACLVWATWFSLVAIDRRHPAYQVVALVLLYCGVRTYPGYVFLPLVLTCCGVLLTVDRRSLARGLLRHCLPQLLVILAALAPTIAGTVAGNGREAHVASFNLPLALSGYAAMFGHLTAGWARNLAAVASFPAGYAFAFAGVFAAAVAMLALVERQQASGLQGRATLLVAAAAIAVMLACYLPYSISDVRYGAGRTLVGARAGYFLLLVLCVDALWRMTPRPRWLATMLCCVSVGLLLVSAMAQRAVFEQRYRQSVFQRVLLADLAATLPCPTATPVLIMTPPKTLGRNSGGGMLINRIQYPVRTMYRTRDVQVVSANRYMLVRSAQVGADGTLAYLGQHLGPEPLLLRYSFHTGFDPVRTLSIQVGASRTPVVLHGAMLPAQRCAATPLMQALLDAFPRNRDLLGLPQRVAGARRHPVARVRAH